MLDNLEAASRSIRDLGLFARESKWDIVYMKAVDALSSCRTAHSHWDDTPSSRKMRNKLNTAATIARSIATITGNIGGLQLDEKQKSKILETQLEIGELLGAVIGHIEKEQRKAAET